MRKSWIILAVLMAFALVGTVSAFDDIKFDYNGDLVVKYLSSEAWYNNSFGIFEPGPSLFLGKIHDVTPPVTYTNVGRCSKGENVTLYITTPGPNDPAPRDPYGPTTYYSNLAGPDNLNHATPSLLADGSYNVTFEDSWLHEIDDDTNDVILNVACIPDPIPTPEFPTMALPAALIVGMLGAVLFIQRSKEN
jgi:hypothetical protein